MKKLFIIAIIALGLALPAAAQVTPTRVQSCFTNATITCLTATTSLPIANLVTNQVKLQRHLGIGVLLVGGASTNTGVVGVQFNVMYAGTNNLKSSTTPITATFTANGVTAVRDWYVLPDYTLGPVDGLVLAGITNAAVNIGLAGSSVIVSNVWLQTLP